MNEEYGCLFILFIIFVIGFSILFFAVPEHRTELLLGIAVGFVIGLLRGFGKSE